MSHANANDNDEEWIPCEICETLVRFCDYREHAYTCLSTHPENRQRSLPLMSDLFFSFQDEILGTIRIPVADLIDAINQGRTSNLPYNADNTEDGTADGEDANGTEDGDDVDSTIDDQAYETYAPRMNANGHQSLFFTPNLLMIPDAAIIQMNEYEFNTLYSEVLGNVEVGIKDLTQVLEDVDNSKNIKDDDVCVVCQEYLSSLPAETKVVQTLCKHKFCKTCIEPWLAKHKKCPTCMTDLQELVETKIETHKPNVDDK